MHHSEEASAAGSTEVGLGLMDAAASDNLDPVIDDGSKAGPAGGDGQDHDDAKRSARLSSLYDQVPEYDGGIDPQPFMGDVDPIVEGDEELKPPEPPEQSPEQEAPDEGFGRFLDDAAPPPSSRDRDRGTDGRS